MDERVMLEWVDDVLKPYVETVPPDVVPLLFLDLYKCHLMSSVVTKFKILASKFSTFQADALVLLSLWTWALTSL
jgi:hypothetical protein